MRQHDSINLSIYKHRNDKSMPSTSMHLKQQIKNIYAINLRTSFFIYLRSNGNIKFTFMNATKAFMN